MPEGISKLLSKIKTFWKELDKSQKTRIYVMASILLIAVIVTMTVTLRVNYVELFDSAVDINLQPVVAYLEENGIRYKKGTNQILVDSRRKKDIEFDLTTQGLVSPEVTFADTWSKLSLNATESDKAHLWKNYLTNDLVYKMKKFKNVRNATVQYSKPEQTFWLTDDAKDQGSAYVMLETIKPLAPDQVDAAARVVAASLGVPPENVTIVDQNLNPLSRNDGSDMAKATTQDEMRRQRRIELENKVYDHFKVGVVQSADYDTMSVSANPVLDFDTLKSTSKQYSAPDSDGEGFRNSYETLEENLKNGDAGDIPGTDTNPGTSPSYQSGDNTNSEYNKSQSVESRLFNETNSETEKALGKLISSQSSMSITLWYGKTVLTPDNLNQEYLDNVKQLASKATGIPAQNITVGIQKLVPEPTPVVRLTDTLMELLDKFGFYALMLILLIIMVLTAMPKKKSAARDAAALEAAAAGGAGESGKPAMEIQDINIEEQSELKKQIEKFVQQNPDAVAQLLRNWLAEDWD
jgi:flagellar M-ring protein FliF